MNFWTDGILQFLYPRPLTCPLCGEDLRESHTTVCRPCYLELVWEPELREQTLLMDEYDGDMNADDAFCLNKREVRVMTVSAYRGKMKFLLNRMLNAPEKDLVSLLTEFLVSKAGGWLGDASAIGTLWGHHYGNDLNMKLNAILARECAQRVGIPFWERSALDEAGERRSYMYGQDQLRFTHAQKTHLLLIGGLLRGKKQAMEAGLHYYKAGAVRVDIVALAQSDG